MEDGAASRRYLPALFDFESLFADLLPLARPGDSCSEEDRAKWQRLAGFPSGSKILITGEAGAGKTTFALATARALMVQWARRRVDDHRQTKQQKPWSYVFEPSKTEELVDHELCFLSTEVDLPRLQHLFSQYGWFGDKDEIFCHTAPQDRPMARTLLVPPIGEDKVRLPLLGSAEIVDLVLKKLKEAYCQRSQRNVFVIVDSLTAVLKDSRDSGERRRDAQQFIQRITEAIRPSQLALAFLIVEHPPRPDPAMYADEVAADFVFRLGQSQTSPGRWLRTFTVAKSAGVNMSVGQHTWAVMTSGGLDDVIAQPTVAEWIAEEAKRGAADDKWATIGVFPKPKLGPIGTENKRPDQRRPNERAKTGIRGLDELLKGDVNYWITDARNEGALGDGTTTLLVGTTGTGKTTMCLQFLAAEDDKSQTLFVNFDTRPTAIASLYEVRSQAATSDTDAARDAAGEPAADRGCAATQAQPGAAFGGLFDKWQTLYRRRGNLDLNLLLSELRFVMREKSVKRIALDGLSDLLATTQRDDYARMVEAVLGTIRDVDPRALIFVAFEFDARTLETEFPVVEGLSATADHVVALRRILINDEFRKTAYVLKARGMNPDAQVREVHITGDINEPVSIRSGLESYRDLLSHHPRPIEVYLQLFAENPAERRFNRWMVEHLKALFGYTVHTFGFSRSAIARTLQDAVAKPGRIPYADVKVFSLDEWWVREYGAPGQSGAVQPRRESGPADHPLLAFDSFFHRPPAVDDPQTQAARPPGEAPNRLAQYHSSPAQFWVFEVEKATDVGFAAAHSRINAQGSTEVEARLLAVPNYTDFAMFCVNRQILEAIGGPPSTSERMRGWLDVIRDLPRAWLSRNEKAPFGFEEPFAREPKVLVDWMKAASDKGYRGFCFDMETTESTVCAFLELCWAFGASEEFLISDTIQFASRTEEDRRSYVLAHPATDALRLLEYLVYHGLMNAWPSLRDTENSLFSRHWYSTVAEWEEECRRTRTRRCPDRSLSPWPMPFFPIGVNARASDCDHLTKSVAEAYLDAVNRFHRLAHRVYAALLYRGAESVPGGELKAVGAIRRKSGGLKKQPHTKADVLSTVDHLRRWGDELRQIALRSSVLARGRIPETHGSSRFAKLAMNSAALRVMLPAARTLNLRDVLELLRWHELRLAILEAECGLGNARKGLETVIADHLGVPAPDPSAQPRNVTALTGYCCSGSWLLGVGRRTHNPSLSWQLIEQMTSFDAAVRRSRYGAGVPVRKDFYDIHGEEKVPHAEHLTWNNLLLFGGARARRRDRTLCPGILAATVFDAIHRHVLQCLTLANSWRGLPDTVTAATADAWPVEAVYDVFKGIHEAMQSMAVRSQTSATAKAQPCVSCPHPEKCRPVLTIPSGGSTKGPAIADTSPVALRADT
jgi:KaiC/GvpD/RAD55 family RecA-like ATPase